MHTDERGSVRGLQEFIGIRRMFALHGCIVKHPCDRYARVPRRVAVSLHILKRSKGCGTLHAYVIVCGMTVHTEGGLVYPDWSFADRLRKARTTVGMTQEEFAAAIDVKEGTLAAWEADRAQPRSRDIVDVAKRIEAVTKIPTSWLLGIDDGPPPTTPASRPFRQPIAPPRRLRAVSLQDAAQVRDDVSDDALTYVRLAGAEELVSPHLRPRRSTGSGGPAGDCGEPVTGADDAGGAPRETRTPDLRIKSP